MNESELLATSSTMLFRLLSVSSEALRLHKWDLANLSVSRCRVILPALRSRIPDFANNMPAHLGEALQTPARPEVSLQSAASGMGSSLAASGSAAVGHNHGPQGYASTAADFNPAASMERNDANGGNAMMTMAQGADTGGIGLPLSSGAHSSGFQPLDWRTLGLTADQEGWMPLDVGLGFGDLGVLFNSTSGLG